MFTGIKWSNELDDTMFNRQFRLCRSDFYYLLLKIEVLLSVVEQQTVNSPSSPQRKVDKLKKDEKSVNPSKLYGRNLFDLPIEQLSPSSLLFSSVTGEEGVKREEVRTAGFFLR